MAGKQKCQPQSLYPYDLQARKKLQETGAHIHKNINIE